MAKKLIDPRSIVPELRPVGIYQICDLLKKEYRAVRQWQTDARRNEDRMVLGAPFPEEKIPKGRKLGCNTNGPLYELMEIITWADEAGLIEFYEDDYEGAGG